MPALRLDVLRPDPVPVHDEKELAEVNGRNPRKNEAIKREKRAAPSTTGVNEMSLEAQVEKLNANFDRLIGLLQGTNAIVIDAQAKGEKASVGKPPADKKADAPKADAIDYEKQIKPAVLALATKKGRDVLIETLKKFGIATAKDAKSEQYAELLKALTDAAA